MDGTTLARAWTVVDAREAEVRGVPSTRRALGAYATPLWLVRFLTARVLDPLLRRASTRDEMLGLRVLDPACGAGAFLLGAADRIARALGERGESPARARVRAARAVRGIDVDPGAVACARRALALYADDDRAGESVVLGDALDDRGLATVAGVHSLNAVLGNPPWLREKDARGLLERARAGALGKKYGAPRMDLWYLFAHAALEALGPGGRHGFIVPAYWLDSASAARLRAHVSAEAGLEMLLDLGAARVFPGVSSRCVAYVVEKSARRGKVERLSIAGALDEGATRALETGASHASVRVERVSAETLIAPDGRISTGSTALREIARAMEEQGAPRDWRVSEGVTPGPDAWTFAVARRAAAAAATTVEALESARGIRRGEGVFIVPRDFAARELNELERSLVLPFATPREIPAAEVESAILYITRETLPRLEDAPALVRHLERFRPALDRRRETLRGTRRFCDLHWPRERALFSGPRVLVPRMVRRPRAAFVDETLVVGESVLVLVPPPSLARAAAALLNTAPARAWLLARGKRRGVGIDVSVALLRAFPWPRRIAAMDDEEAARAWGLDPARVSAALEDDDEGRSES